MSIASQISGAVSGFVNFNKWAWSPTEASASMAGAIGGGVEVAQKLAVRAITVGTAGAVAALGAYKLGVLGATVAASTAVGFGFVATLGAVGGAILLHSLFQGVYRK